MVSRERLLEIDDLKIAKRLLSMGKRELETYAQGLNKFIDDFPSVETEIRALLEKKEIESLRKRVLSIRDGLTKIGADDIAAECWKYVSGFNSEKPAKFEAYVNFLLSQLAALSFDIQMALYKDDETHTTAEASSDVKETAEEDNQNAKVIIAVDDDPQCLDMFKMALKEVSCKIIAVTSGMAALNILKKQKPDLFVLDIDMPEMNGLDLAKKVREAGFSAPIVFITGNAQKDVVMKALQVGGQDFILKPINPQNVVGRITKFI